jgi:hypothetical protein
MMVIKVKVEDCNTHNLLSPNFYFIQNIFTYV